VASAADAHRLVVEDLTLGVGADSAIITVDVVSTEVVDAAVEIIRKGGRVVLTAIANPEKHTVQVPSSHLTLFQKSIHGLLFGGCNPVQDIRKMIDLYQAGKYKLDELVTGYYRLDDINQGYQDLLDGKTLRGIIAHEH
jgi:S-(hydroxymethyl)glutathione dehydrogenase/alcohol dehydrogenase